MVRAPFPDKNQNGYPDAFEAQEAQMLAQIAARRRAYMQRYGNAESTYTNAEPNPANDNGEPPVQAGSEEKMIDDLFR